MAEAERRLGKTPLLKQPEIEEAEEEEQSQSDEVLVNSSSSDACAGKNVCQDDRGLVELGAYSPPLAANGAAANSCDVPATSSPSSTQAQVSPSPERPPSERSLKMNHSFSSKAKPLVRGTAICDDSVPTSVLPEVKVITTPAPDSDDSPCDYNGQPPLLGQDGAGGQSMLQKNGSISSDAGTSNCSLSRESSIEKNFYKDSSGCDLEEFIKKTLVKSKKDKQMLLSLERDFKIFVDSQDQHYQLAEMCSYDRMICHRVAAFYGMEHNIDKSGKCVIVSKTKFTRIPTFNCEDYVRTVEPADEAGSEKKQMRLLLKKPASMEERSRGGDKAQFSSHRTKSLEERQKTYEEKRKMIFGAEENAPSYSVIEPASASGGCKRLNSREWSSTDSSGYVSEDGSRLRRSVMAKSNSYGDSITSYDSVPVRTKLASPENSQSPISRSSSADVNSPNLGYGGVGTGPPYTVLVATDINTIPPGSMVVNPHTLQPHTNADGTPYRYNPNDPTSVPPWLAGSAPTPTQQQPGTTNITFNPSPSVHQVQYTQNNDLCNRFSAMEVATPMEASMEGQQMMAIGHQPPQHQPVPQAHHQHQQPGQVPLMVSTAMQPTQQYLSTYTATAAAQGTGFYTGAQLQFVPVDAQGQCLSLAPAGTSFQSGVGSYAQPQLVPTASTMQPGMMDQSSMTPGTLYGQSVYTGTVTDTGGGAGGYCMPYVPNNSVLYSSTHYPLSGNGGNGMTMTPTAAAHYNPYNPPQSSSPQLCSFAPMTTGQVRPATPPNLPIAQPVGYHSQQTAGMGLSHGVSSPPHFQHGTYYTAPPHHFPTQGQPMGQMVQMSVRPQGGGGVQVSGGHPHHHPQSLQGAHQPGHPNAPTLQHSQSFPMLRTVPTSMSSCPAPAPAPLGLGPAPNGPTNPPHPGQHPMMSVKSVSVGSVRSGGGAATPDRETPTIVGGATAFLPGFSQATSMQFPGQFVAQGMRQPQPGDLRVMGAPSIRPQMAPSLIAFQPGQPIRQRPAGPRQSRPPKRHNSNISSNNPATTTASASVARVMSLDSGSAVQQAVNRQ